MYHASELFTQYDNAYGIAVFRTIASA